jgi:hypothetical protein
MSNVVSNINPQKFIGGTHLRMLGMPYEDLRKQLVQFSKGFPKGNIKHPLILFA